MVVSTWGSLGVYRGVQQYNYLEERKNNSTYFYTSAAGNGFMGAFIYVNPLLAAITIPKELYRMEVVIRDLPKDHYFYSIL